MRMSFNDAIMSGVDEFYPILMDKVELKIKLGSFYPTPSNDDENDDFVGYAGNVGRSSYLITDSTHSPHIINNNESAEGGWVFNTLSTHYEGASRFNYFKYKVSSGSGSNNNPRGTYPIPLFAGEMIIYRASGMVELTTSLNPTRYHLYNSHVHTNRESRENLIGFTEAMREEVFERRSLMEREYSMDGSDNYLPQYRNSPPMFSSLRILRRYACEVEQVVGQELDRATTILPEGSYIPRFFEYIGDSPKYTLDFCEVYAEFTSESPAQTLRELSPILALYSRSGVLEREYEEPIEEHGSPYEEELTEQGWIKSYIIRLSNQNTIAIYAKTNRRIRVEVRYNNKKGSARPLSGGKTCADLDELYGKCERLNHTARGEINRLFSYIRSHNITISDSSVPITQLIMDVYEHCEHNRDVAEIILRQLAEYRCIRSFAGDVEGDISKAIKSMRYKAPQVVESNSDATHTGLYMPKPNYQWAVSRLAEEGFWQRCIRPSELPE